MLIDTTFDFRTDATTSDPDRSSPTLRCYHRLLWSKPLPGGQPFNLDTSTPGEYLHHRSEALGEFFLSSDSVIATYSYYQSAAGLIAQIPQAVVEDFETISYTIGGMLVFPSNKINRKPAINMARGTNRRRIGDRIDLTLECIRRHYSPDTDSPLAAVLARYPKFFGLFGDFRGYFDFFLLQDLVTPDYGSVRFFLPFDDFATPAIPNKHRCLRAVPPLHHPVRHRPQRPHQGMGRPAPLLKMQRPTGARDPHVATPRGAARSPPAALPAASGTALTSCPLRRGDVRSDKPHR